MVYVMIKHRNKPVLSNKESWMQENELNNFRTIVSEVSSFVGNPYPTIKDFMDSGGGGVDLTNLQHICGDSAQFSITL